MHWMNGWGGGFGRRYARGEISKEEFEEKKKDLL